MEQLSFLQRLALWLIRSQVLDLRKSAYADGYKKGQLAGEATGHETGYAKGMDDGKAVWELIDSRSFEPTFQPDTSIYGPDRLKVTEAMKQQMRADVANAVRQKKLSPPTESQWDMILSDHPATCVIAGAGAGKSTTLILRVVFMLIYLQIPKERITVISFTNASCKKLRDDIQEKLGLWKYQLLNEEALQLVKTFHATLARMARALFPGVKWFDVLKDRDDSLPQDDDVDEEIDNPFLKSRLSALQKELLSSAYRKTFMAKPEFRKHVGAILSIECNRDVFSFDETQKYHRRALVRASRREQELVTRISDAWKKRGTWPLGGIDDGPFEAFKVDGIPFYANGRIRDTGMPVFLSLYGTINGNEIFPTDEVLDADASASQQKPFTVYKALKMKRRVIATYFGGKALNLASETGIDRLRLRIQYNPDEFRYEEAPKFATRLNGEIKAAEIFEALYAQGTFIENIGKEVTDAVKDMLNKKLFKEGSIEFHFANALALFWPEFEALLMTMQPKMMTFNRAFLLIGQGTATPSKSSLLPLTHLLIDEFQDISPQIVKWLHTSQKSLASEGHKPTVMAIGDDWQSIYGWRGSAPDVFIKFGDFFPVNEELDGHKECKMLDNYRSTPVILQHAELILKTVENKTEKEANPKRLPQACDHGVVLVKEFDLSKNDYIEQVASKIQEQLGFVNSLSTCDDVKVIVLSRGNSVLDAVRAKYKNLYGPDAGVQFYTFHQAKGLQGEVAILLDNCVYEEEHVFRNAVYKVSDVFEQTYDEAARDEAMRLAYVAITRGIRRVYWFVNQPKGAAEIIDRLVPQQ